jgi:hypothetical protein
MERDEAEDAGEESKERAEETGKHEGRGCGENHREEQCLSPNGAGEGNKKYTNRMKKEDWF